MKKKLNFAINILLLVVFCLMILSGCSAQKGVDPWEAEESLNLMGKLVRALDKWIGSYGWAVVVFTVFLKIAMLPLDIWQRFSTGKMSAKMKRIQPLVDDIDKRYGANTQRAAEEKQKLFKRHGYSMTSSCLPMIITMVVFFVMFGGLRNYSTYKSLQTFNTLAENYYQTFAEEIINDDSQEATVIRNAFVEAYQNAGGSWKSGEYDEKYTATEHTAIYTGISNVTTALTTLAQQNSPDYETCLKIKNGNETAALEKVKDVYQNDLKESWLWIQNIAQPDTWEPIMASYSSGQNSFQTIANLEEGNYSEDGKDLYNTIQKAVLETGGYGKNGSWNGLMILPILSIGLSFLSMYITQAMEKKNRGVDQQQAAQNKTMMIMMPLMMAFFGFMYTGAFAIYMVANYLISIVSTILLRAPVNKMVEKSIAKLPPAESGKTSYMR